MVKNNYATLYNIIRQKKKDNIMSSGSYFTIYRKYNAVAANEVFDALQTQYLNEYKADGFSNKSDEELLKDLPPVLDFAYGIHESEYDEATKQWKDKKDYSIEGQRKQYLSILKSDKTYLDELLTWYFSSSFTCLKSEWHLNAYSGQNSMFIVDKPLAEKILQACNYLLSEKWSDDFEKILDNEWINILADGNDSQSYWKYVYRNDKKHLREVLKEDDNSIEYDIKQLQHVLQTFVSVDDSYTNYGKTTHILAYKVW